MDSTCESVIAFDTQGDVLFLLTLLKNIVGFINKLLKKTIVCGEVQTLGTENHTANLSDNIVHIEPSA